MNDSQHLFVAQYEKHFPIKIEDIRMTKEPKSKTLARHGSLDKYVDSLPAHRQQAIKDESASVTTSIEKIIQAAIEVRTERNLLEDSIGGGEIQWAEAMTEPVDKLIVALDQYQLDDTFNDDTVVQTFGSLDASKMHLIGIAGPARAGKDTLASYMLDNLGSDWSRSSFADPIKSMLKAIGVDCSDDKKAVVSDDYGVTPRHMMQTLGTEWGRNLIDGDIWVKAFARLNAGKCVIVPDVRFENEADLVREHGVLIHLVGRGGIEGNHVSENAIAFKPGDIVIDNSRDLDWLHDQVDGNAVLGDFISEVGE